MGQVVKSIAVFNNKGGVGKTTLLCNLASEFALNRNKKVLVVDADPQCNATQSLFNDKQIDNFFSSRKQPTIRKVVEPLQRGKGFAQAVEVEESANFGVDVLLGDPELGLAEDLLATDWVQGSAGELRGMRTTLLFSHLLEGFSEYDFVFFDMGPSLGSINRSVLISCDFFLTPISLDIFSLKAIENISKTLKTWKVKYESGISHLLDPKEELEVANPSWHLDYIGYVTQQYTFKRDKSGEARPVRAFEKIMNKVPDTIHDNLDYGNRRLEDLNLGSIPTLHSLVPMSQTSRKPIFKLGAQDGVVGAHFAKVKLFHEIVQGVADNVSKNVGGK